jgi:hypothetical protein
VTPNEDPDQEAEQKPFGWMGVGADKYHAVFEAIKTGEIEEFDQPKLLAAARALAAYHFDHVAQDQTAAALLVHNLQIAHTLKEIDRSNRCVQMWVIVLAAVTLLVGCLQTYFMICPRH